MLIEEIKKTIPEYYSEEQKNEIIILLKQLANIYLDIMEESF
jgi:hypothetical protein